MGLWDQSCLHLDIRNYTLEVWSGYYKSVHSMAHCDASFAPILVRREILEKVKNLKLDFSTFPIADRLIFFTANPDLRVLHCPDCMFYTNVRNALTKQDLMEVARRLQVTEIRIENEEFSYNCNEIGFKCSLSLLRRMTYSKSGEAKRDKTVGGSLPPPPCQAAQGRFRL